MGEENPEQDHPLEEEGWVGETSERSEELRGENISEDWKFANKNWNENKNKSKNEEIGCKGCIECIEKRVPCAAIHILYV